MADAEISYLCTETGAEDAVARFFRDPLSPIFTGRSDCPSPSEDLPPPPSILSDSDFADEAGPSGASPAEVSRKKPWLALYQQAASSTSEHTLEIQLADGTESILKFSSQGRIRDIRDYIDSSRPGESKDYQLLTKGAPQRELTDMNQTIEEAGIIGSGLIQKYFDCSSPTMDESSLAGSDSPVSDLFQSLCALATTLTIVLHDGTELELSFNNDQTIRDIHDRIDEIRPDDIKDYYFLDSYAQELRDLDKTIEEACFGGSKLAQMDDN